MYRRNLSGKLVLSFSIFPSVRFSFRIRLSVVCSPERESPTDVQRFRISEPLFVHLVRSLVRASRCRRWITGFSTGQLVPFHPFHRATTFRLDGPKRRWEGGGEHPTGLNGGLWIILVSLRLSVSHLSDLHLPWTSDLSRLRCLFPIGSLQSLLPRRFEWTELRHRRKALASGYFYQLFPNQLFPRLFSRDFIQAARLALKEEISRKESLLNGTKISQPRRVKVE